MSSIILRRHPPQLLNDEQYKDPTGVLVVALGHKSAMTPQLLNNEQYNI
jgi:hypothetical protein